MKHWYNTPEILPAIGQSNHMSIFFQSLNRQQRPNTTTKVWIPKRNPWNIKAIGRFLNDLDWSVLTFLPSCQEKCDFFYNIIRMGLDTILPKKSVKLHCRDKPWITPDLKFLISQRQKAFVSGNLSEYNMLRNKVIREVKQSKFKFYESQISNLKNSKPRKWWSAIKSLAGYSKRSLLRSVEVDGSIMQGKDLATAINKAFVAPSEMMPPLTPLDKQPIENPSISYFISAADVEPRLRQLNPISPLVRTLCQTGFSTLFHLNWQNLYQLFLMPPLNKHVSHTSGKKQMSSQYLRHALSKIFA